MLVILNTSTNPFRKLVDIINGNDAFEPPKAFTNCSIYFMKIKKKKQKTNKHYQSKEEYNFHKKKTVKESYLRLIFFY